MNSESKFSNEQFNSVYGDGMENYYWTLARNKIIYKELIKRGIANKKILEIGCAKGLVVSYLKGKGLNIYGSEIGNPKVLKGIEKLIFVNKDCNDLPIEFRESIQIIMLLDVIEHIENPIEFMQSIVKHYPNVIYFVILVPARMELWSSYDIKYNHYKRYSIKKLQEELDCMGFKTMTIRYLFRLLYLPALFISKFLKKRNENIRPPKSKIQILLHRIAALILYIDYKILNKDIYGSSIISISKKNDER